MPNLDAIDPSSISPPADANELWLRFLKWIQGSKRVIISGIAVTATEMPRRHNQRSKPRTAIPVPSAVVTVAVTRIDATFVYLQASAPVTIDLILEM